MPRARAAAVRAGGEEKRAPAGRLGGEEAPAGEDRAPRAADGAEVADCDRTMSGRRRRGEGTGEWEWWVACGGNDRWDPIVS